MPSLLSSFNQGMYYPGLVNASPELQDMQIGLTHAMMQDEFPDEKYGKLTDGEKADLISFLRAVGSTASTGNRADKAYEIRKHGALWKAAIK